MISLRVYVAVRPPPCHAASPVPAYWRTQHLRLRVRGAKQRAVRKSMEGGITTASAARVCAGGDGGERKSSVSMTIDRGLNVFEPLSCIVLKPFSVWLHNRPQQFFGVTTHLNRFNPFKLTTGNLCFFMKTIQRGWVEPTDPNEGGGGSVEDSCLRLGAALGRHSSLLPKRCLTDCRFRTSDPFDCDTVSKTRKTRLHEPTFGTECASSPQITGDGVEQRACTKRVCLVPRPRITALTH